MELGKRVPAKRRVELPIADTLGRIGPTLNVTLGGKTFTDVPLLWQDWTLWQHCVVEEEYGSTSKFQRMWLGLDDTDPEGDPREQAQSLMERAQRINEAGTAKEERKTERRTSPLMALGTAEGLSMRDQAFYAYVLLGPWEAIEREEGELTHALSLSERMAGPSSWTVSLEWFLANATPTDLQMLLAQILVVQLQANAAELEGEAETGDHPKEDS